MATTETDSSKDPTPVAAVPSLPAPATRKRSVDADSLYGLNSYEQKWVTYQPYLLEKGYSLRPRYHPGWVPSWTGTDEYPPDCEDSWAMIVESLIFL